jgi:DNA repair protein RecN (Recombination protein N)
MLVELRVENLGIIADLLLPLADGMTVITGETGAGKTLIVDALDLLCGGRADPSLVRDGADEAHVEGRFVDGEDEVVLARVIPVRGRSRGYINGHLATAAELAARGRTFVDLHGQHAHQALLIPAEQRLLLDRYAGPAAVSARAELTAARAVRRRAEQDQRDLGGDDRSRVRQLDLLRYEVAEIDAAAIDDPEEEAALATEEDILADAEAHRAALEVAYERLEGPAQDALGAAIAAVTAREPFAAIADRLRGLQIDAAEVGHDVRVAAEQIVADPERLADVQQRRARLRELVRKYGPTLADVHTYALEARDRIAQLEGHEERAAALDVAIAEADRAVAHAAQALSSARREAAGPFATAVEGHLRALAMPAANFEVAVETGDFETAGEDGADEVTFLLAPNPGESARPLARAASGGELARAMLALRVVCSAAPPTLVFDEVDAGIGGEAGTAVGRALATLGGQHQVLCVTHLPQVAAFADAQIAVSKSEMGRRTVAAAELVLDDARVGEVSRMLAGVGESSHARRHAQELLARAHEARTASRAQVADHEPARRTTR